MSTLSVPQPPGKRRRFSHEFKTRIIAACNQPSDPDSISVPLFIRKIRLQMPSLFIRNDVFSGIVGRGRTSASGRGCLGERSTGMHRANKSDLEKALGTQVIDELELYEKQQKESAGKV